MSQTLERIKILIDLGEVVVSAHGYDELARDHILVREVVEGITNSLIVEDYPKYGKGPCTLVLQRDQQGNPLHVVWGIPKGKSSPAVLITAYRPDPNCWYDDYIRRKK
jgi:hypothetical protein